MAPVKIGVVVEKNFRNEKEIGRQESAKSTVNAEGDRLYFVDPDEHREFVNSMFSLLDTD